MAFVLACSQPVRPVDGGGADSRDVALVLPDGIGPSTCSNGTVLCGMEVRNCLSDPFNCGDCYLVCPGQDNAPGACLAGRCGFTCSAGFEDCDRLADNGCETPTSTNQFHCGACGRSCPSPPRARPDCAAGVCGFICEPGFGDCNGLPSDGCEASLATTTMHCGACGTTCPANANAAPACSDNRCGNACTEPFGDCDGIIDNGCEIDTQRSAAHCGGCGRSCPVRDHASAACASGVCGLSCDAGFGDCDADAANGCELGTVADNVNCGRCGNRCAPGSTCVGSNCEGARPIAPPSTATVGSRRPMFLWELSGSGITGGHVEICADRACTMLVTSLDGTNSATPAADLPSGPLFWRVLPRRGTVTSSVPSAAWELFVGTRSTPRDTRWGSVLDVNGDGYSDVMAGGPNTVMPGAEGPVGTVVVRLGGIDGVEAVAHRTYVGTSYDKLGTSVASAGDVNGDGFGDVILGAPSEIRGGAGRAFVYFGSAAGLPMLPDWERSGTARGNLFGNAVAAAGDVNQDGYGDVIVAAASAGTVSLFLGSAAGLSATAAREFAVVAPSIAGAGDLNGDGFTDIAIAGGAVAARSISIYHGGPGGLGTAPAVVLRDGGSDPSFGRALTIAGDINGDGFCDLIQGSPSSRTGSGSASVFLGGPSGIDSVAHRVYNGVGATDAMGFTVAFAGDVNRDGFGEAILGAPGAGLDRYDPGTASVFLGGATGLAATPQTVIVGRDVFNQGRAGYVSGAGDVDRDGFDDVIIGAPRALPSGTASIYRGGPSGISATPQIVFSPPLGRSICSGRRSLPWAGGPRTG